MRGTIERRKKLYMGSKSSSALGRSVGTPSKRFPVIVVIVIVVIIVIVIVSYPSKKETPLTRLLPGIEVVVVVEGRTTRSPRWL